MSSTIIESFNGPFKRAELMLLPQYAASDRFLAAGKWTGTKNHVLTLNDSDGTHKTEPLYCIVVGTVTADKAYLGKHGNFNPKFNDAAQKAKLQFTLARPDDPDFGPDYDQAVVAFNKHQSDVSITALQQYFLSKSEGDTMRMNYRLFEPKGEKSDKEKERDTLAYCVDRDYEPYWTSAKVNNYSCIMPVYDTNDTLIIPGHFASKLVCATCEVTFTLKHFAIGGHKNKDGIWMDASDVFSAHVETVAILRKPPVLVRSPYKSRKNRRPHHKPQLPTRGEHINAAQAFLPRPEYNNPGPSESIAATASESYPDTDNMVVPTSLSSALLADVSSAQNIVTDAIPNLVETINTKISRPDVIEAIISNAVIEKIRIRDENQESSTLDTVPTSDEIIHQTTKKRKLDN